MTSPAPPVPAPPCTAHSGATGSSTAYPEKPATVITTSGRMPGSRHSEALTAPTLSVAPGPAALRARIAAPRPYARSHDVSPVDPHRPRTEPRAVPRRAASLIRTEGLTKRFGSVTALDALTVDVRPGVTGLVGANGAGKSTLLKILLGLLPATEGSASVLGLDVATDGPAIRERVGYMPEHDCLPPDVSATEFVVHMARMSGLPDDGRPRARRRHAAPRRPLRGALPADGRLLHRHAAAGQARPGAGARPQPWCCSTSPRTGSTPPAATTCSS